MQTLVYENYNKFISATDTIRQMKNRVDSMAEVKVKQGEVIMRDGDKGNNFYVIKEGTCDVMVTDESGDMKHVRTLSAGNSCGELSLLTGNPRSATIQVRNIWKTMSKCKACGEFMTGPGRAPQICGSCYFSCCSRCVQQMEVPRCPFHRCDSPGAYSRNLALQAMADTLVRSGQVEVPLSLEDPTDSLATPRPVAAMLQMTQLTLDALGLQQKEWEQKYLEEMKRNDQARKSRAKKRGAREEPVRSKSAE